MKSIKILQEDNKTIYINPDNITYFIVDRWNMSGNCQIRFFFNDTNNYVTTGNFDSFEDAEIFLSVKKLI